MEEKSLCSFCNKTLDNLAFYLVGLHSFCISQLQERENLALIISLDRAFSNGLRCDLVNQYFSGMLTVISKPTS